MTTAFDQGLAGSEPALEPPEPRVIDPGRTRGDKVFRAVSVAGGSSSLVILGLIFLFLLLQSIEPLREMGWRFLTEFDWAPDFVNEDGRRIFGIGALLFGTVLSSVIALVLAVPVAVATAVFVNEYAPRRLRMALTTLIDLLAAVPSLIFGLWGLYYLQPRLEGTTRFIADYFGWIPIFEVRTPLVGNSPFMAGVVLALMIVPIVASVSREVMSQVPRMNCEAALALGGTRWGMVRHVVLPHGRSGIIGASMLGLGRALGETIAVALILSPLFDITPRILEPGGNSIAANIALAFNESGEFGRKALIASGFALFLVTLLVNMAARSVVNRAVSARGLDL